MKKFILIIFCLYMCFSLFACVGNIDLSSQAGKDPLTSDSSSSEENPSEETPPTNVTYEEWDKYKESPIFNDLIYVDANPQENKYENHKLQAPPKTVDIVEYQDYGIAQIERYIEAVKTDENIFCNSYITTKMLELKYKIYTETNKDVIDELIVKSEDYIRKYLLKDEVEEAYRKYKIRIRQKNNITDTYDRQLNFLCRFDDVYVFANGGTSLTEINNYTIENFSFDFTRTELITVWNGKYHCTLITAYENNLINYEQLEEIFKIHRYSYLSSIQNTILNELSITNPTEEELNSTYLASIHARYYIRTSSSIELYFSLMSKDFSHHIPENATHCEIILIDDTGSFVNRYRFLFNELNNSLLMQGIVNYSRDGKVSSIETHNMLWLRAPVENYHLGKGWIKASFKIYTKGEKVLYSVESNKLYFKNTQKEHLNLPFHNVYDYDVYFSSSPIE